MWLLPMSHKPLAYLSPINSTSDEIHPSCLLSLSSVAELNILTYRANTHYNLHSREEYRSVGLVLRDAGWITVTNPVSCIFLYRETLAQLYLLHSLSFPYSSGTPFLLCVNTSYICACFWAPYSLVTICIPGPLALPHLLQLQISPDMVRSSENSNFSQKSGLAILGSLLFHID